MVAKLVLMLALVGADQLLKYWAATSLKAAETIPLWQGVFHLTYVENRGAAAGILQGQQTFLIVVTSVVLLGLLLLIVLRKIPGRWLPWVACLVCGGGAGNLIDRAARGFVVDYLDFRLIHFPVFNLADSLIVVGVCLAVLAVLFGKDGKFLEEKKPSSKQEKTQQPDHEDAK